MGQKDIGVADSLLKQWLCLALCCDNQTRLDVEKQLEKVEITKNCTPEQLVVMFQFSDDIPAQPWHRTSSVIMFASQPSAAVAEFIFRFIGSNQIKFVVRSVDFSVCDFQNIDLSNLEYQVYKFASGTDKIEKEALCKRWIKRLLSGNVGDKTLVMKQLENATMSFEKHHACFYVHFEVPQGIPPLTLRAGVVASMLANQKNTAPIDFLLHVKYHCINMLEVYSADGSQLDIGHIDLADVTHVIHHGMEG